MEGELYKSENGVTYIVVAAENAEDAIKAAKKYFKIKSERLECMEGWVYNDALYLDPEIKSLIPEYNLNNVFAVRRKQNKPA